MEDARSQLAFVVGLSFVRSGLEALGIRSVGGICCDCGWLIFIWGLRCYRRVYVEMVAGDVLAQPIGTDCWTIRLRSSSRPRGPRNHRGRHNRLSPRRNLIFPKDNTYEDSESDTDAIQIFQNSGFRKFLKFGINPPPVVEGKTCSEPETPPADPRAELDKVVTSPQDLHHRYSDLDLLITIFSFASLAQVFEAQRLCKSLRGLSCFSSFLETRARRYPIEPNSLAPLVFYEQDGKLYLMGYDSSDTNSWIRSSPFPFSNNIKSVAGHVGLLCVFVKGPNGPGMHFAYNPLTQNQRQLPPMRFQRSPCVTYLHVTEAENRYKNRYQVIAIGSQSNGTHRRKTEIYESKSNKWTDAAELPEGYLIDNQTGLWLKGHWYGTGSEGLYGRKVVMVLNLENNNWLDPIDLPSRSVILTTVQLLQCNGEIYLFSQDESISEVTHYIYRLKLGSEGGYTWTKKVNNKFVKKEPFSRAEYTCVPVKGKQGGKLGIFKNSCTVNAVTESVCRVYDIKEDEAEITAASQFLPCPPFASESAVLFHPENPIGYSFEPSFFLDA